MSDMMDREGVGKSGVWSVVKVLCLLLIFLPLLAVPATSVIQTTFTKEWTCSNGLTCNRKCNQNPYQPMWEGAQQTAEYSYFFTLPMETSYTCTVRIKTTSFSDSEENEVTDIYIINNNNNNNYFIATTSDQCCLQNCGVEKYPNPIIFDLAQPVYASGPNSEPGGIFVHDLDRDGLLDFIVTTKGHIGAYDHWGSKLWVNTNFKAFGYLHHPSAVAGDMNGDGKEEVAYLTPSNKIEIVNAVTGEHIKTIDPGPSPAGSGFPVGFSIANLRGLGDRDLIVQYSRVCTRCPDPLKAIKAEDGSIIWETIKYFGIEHSLHRQADLDGDGKDEVAGAVLIDDDGSVMHTWDLRYFKTDLNHMESLVIADVCPYGVDCPTEKMIMNCLRLDSNECESLSDNCKIYEYKWYGKDESMCRDPLDFYEGYNAQFPYGHTCAGPGPCPPRGNFLSEKECEKYFPVCFGKRLECTGAYHNCCGCWKHGKRFGNCTNYTVDEDTLYNCSMKIDKICPDVANVAFVKQCKTFGDQNYVACEWYDDRTVLVGVEGMPDEKKGGITCGEIRGLIGELGTDGDDQEQGHKYTNLMSFYHFEQDENGNYKNLWDPNFICCYAKKGTLGEGMPCVLDEECEEGLRCDNETTNKHTATHTCKRLKKICVSERCVKGEECKDSNECEDVCTSDQQCETPPGPPGPGPEPPPEPLPESFLPGTKITLPSGAKSIEDVKEGDHVLSFEDDRLVEKRVANVFSHTSDHYYILKTNNREVKVTGNHEFYIGNGQFRSVADLQEGDKVYVLENGEIVPEEIVYKKLVKGEFTVYDITVEGTHTFFANGFAVRDSMISFAAGDEVDIQRLAGDKVSGARGTRKLSFSSYYDSYDSPLLEVVLAEQGGNDQVLVVNSEKIIYGFYNINNPCAKIPNQERLPDPDKVAVGDFDTTKPGLEVFARSSCGKAPWVIDAQGNMSASWLLEKTAPNWWYMGDSNHPRSGGIEEVSRIDWDGDGEDEIVAKERGIAGAGAIIDPITGEFMKIFEGKATRIYAVDFLGDYREEVITVDADGKVKIFWNNETNTRSSQSYWSFPHYARQKQNWNYYSP